VALNDDDFDRRPMILVDTPEHDALRVHATRFASDRYDLSQHRERLEAGVPVIRKNWLEIADLGWLGTTIDENNGGLGLAYSFLSVLAEALGPALMNEPFTSQVAIAGHLLNQAQPSEPRNTVLDRWLAGTGFVALAHHEGRRGSAGSAIATTFETTASGFVLSGRKTAVIDGALADHVIVAAAAPNDFGLFLVATGSRGLRIDGYRTFDGRHIADVEFNGVRIRQDARLLFALPPMDVVDECWSLYALLLASESLGIVQALLRLTHDYMMEREQFGQKIADFQALQHRLVDMVLATTRAESMVELARYQCDEHGPAGAAAAIAAAKVTAGTTAAFVGQQSVQLHGAIGMTDESIVGYYLKRLTANEILGGNTDEQLTRFTRLREYPKNSENDCADN